MRQHPFLTGSTSASASCSWTIPKRLRTSLIAFSKAARYMVSGKGRIVKVCLNHNTLCSRKIPGRVLAAVCTSGCHQPVTGSRMSPGCCLSPDCFPKHSCVHACRSKMAMHLKVSSPVLFPYLLGLHRSVGSALKPYMPIDSSHGMCLQDDSLLAYQICFDLFENEMQSFVLQVCIDPLLMFRL